jgi:hypothetical protein
MTSWGCRGAMRDIAPSMPPHTCPRHAGVLCRRRQRYIQTCVSAGAPAAKLRPWTKTRRRYVATRINLPLYRQSRIYLLFLAAHLPSCSSPVEAASRRWPRRTATSKWPKQILQHPPTPSSAHCMAPKAREVRVVKSLYFPVRDARARATSISCFPCQTATRSFLRSSAPPALVLPRAPRLQAASSREIAHMQAGQ